MKMLRFFLLTLFVSPFLISPALAQMNFSAFMTSRDLLNNESVSNINLQNNRSSSTTVYGLYVRQYAYVTPGQNCNDATIIYPSSNNITAGAFVSPVMIPSHAKAAVGSNYLYNMLYEAIYYENTIIPSSPPGCALPGCTWGSDTNKYNWCIYLGALAPVSPSLATALIVPSTSSPSSSSYNYDLVNNYINIGPISCDDGTFTCTIATPQTQFFP